MSGDGDSDGEVRMSKEELRQIVREAREEGADRQPIVVNVENKSNASAGAAAGAKSESRVGRTVFWVIVLLVVIGYCTTTTDTASSLDEPTPTITG